MPIKTCSECMWAGWAGGVVVVVVKGYKCKLQNSRALNSIESACLAASAVSNAYAGMKLGLRCALPLPCRHYRDTLSHAIRCNQSIINSLLSNSDRCN